MCNEIEFNQIKNKDLRKSMDDYFIGRERATTKNYFRYEGKLYPVMNIVKVAIENNSDIANDRLYDNLPCCKYIINQLLGDEISFYKMMKEKNE